MDTNKRYTSILNIMILLVVILSLASSVYSEVQESCYLQLSINELKNNETGSISFSLNSQENLYGLYNGSVPVALDDSSENYSDYTLIAYDNTGNILSKYPIYSSRFILYDNFGGCEEGDENCSLGGMIETNEGIISIILSYREDYGSFAIENQADISQISVDASQISCQRTCLIEGESGSYSNNSRCCLGYNPIQTNEDQFTCVNCGDNICSANENVLNCFEDCSDEVECAEGFVKGEYGCEPDSRPKCTSLSNLKIDWKNTSNWQFTNRIRLSFDSEKDAIKIIGGGSSAYLKIKIPVNTNKSYYIEYDVMASPSTSKQYVLYSGTISYNGSDKMLPGHPGSYDYFGDLAAKFTSDVWNHRRNSGINGNPRTGESTNQRLLETWHNGIKDAYIVFFPNYQDLNKTQTTYIKNMEFYEEGCLPEPNCSDTDGGIGYYTAGEVRYNTFAANNNYPDYCSNNILYEQYCDGTKVKKEIAYNCPNGCTDGVCNENPGGAIPLLMEDAESQLKFDKATKTDLGSYAGSYSMLATGYPGPVMSYDMFEVDYTKKYILSGWFKSTGSNKSKLYFGFVPYDENRRPILIQEVYAVRGTETTLYEDAASTDKIIKITDGTNWKKWLYASVAFNVDDSGDYADLPNRLLSNPNIVRVENKGDYWEVEFNTRVGRPYPSGTKIREHFSGGTYSYMAVNELVPQEWTSYAGELPARLYNPFERGEWWRGTRYVKVLILPNHGQTAEYSLAMDNIGLSYTENTEMLSPLSGAVSYAGEIFSAIRARGMAMFNAVIALILIGIFVWAYRERR